MRLGLSEQHGSHGRKSARGIAPVAFRLRRASACPDGGRRTKPGPLLHVRGTVSAGYLDVTESMSLVRAVGHALPALAGRGRMERGTRCARDARGRGD